MKSYEQTFCIEIINDTDASEDHIDNIFAEMLNVEYGKRLLLLKDNDYKTASDIFLF